MRATFLADLFRSGGLEVIEYDGWKSRGSDRFTPLGDVIHHTVTGPRVSDTAVARMLRDGRPDLKGPLVQRGTDRAGRIHLVASGRASHNGYGLWGNDAYGNELFNDGVGERFPEVQIRSAEMQSALLRKHHGWAADKVKGHKETDPRRKIDPYRMDMNAFRQAVEDLMDKPNEGDDELSAEDVKKINERLDWQDRLIGEMYQAVIGSDLPDKGDANPRHMSIFTGVKYLRGEVIGGKREDPNSPLNIWHRIQEKFRTSETT